MTFTDRRKLAHSSLKQFGGLTVTLIQEPLSKTRMRPKGKNASTGGAKRITKPLFQTKLQNMINPKDQQNNLLHQGFYKSYYGKYFLNTLYLQ